MLPLIISKSKAIPVTGPWGPIGVIPGEVDHHPHIKE
jgi:hypothetical protein